MNKPQFIIQTSEKSESVEWKLFVQIASGHAASAPDAYYDSEIHELRYVEEQQNLVSTIPGLMANKPNPEMVPTPLTIEQREQLYKLVYGECTKHVWPTGLDLLTILHNK
ncbi:MAG TPA: hypothetical protein PLO50_00920 [Nitrospira sp.]|nr:hypothetical protein [Nitrospira sp.]